MAICLDLVDGRVDAARVAYGGMAPVPKRAQRCEKALTGATWNQTTVGKAIQALSRDFQPITDVRATDDYRLRVAGNLLCRFFAETDQPDQPATVWNYAAG
jgi:xanthine dehydrogenase small subunit